MKGNLFIVSAPSGAGKTSLLKSLTEETDGIAVSISSTTRPMRPGEVDGVDYHFLDVERFRALIEEDEFLEYAQVYDNYYGTSRSGVMRQLAEGTDVILEIDWQGAAQARGVFADATSIFVIPPSRTALEERLRKRSQDSDEVIARRLAEAREDISHYAEFDYLVINDNFQRALDDLTHIFHCQRLLRAPQMTRHATLLTELLA